MYQVNKWSQIVNGVSLCTLLEFQSKILFVYFLFISKTFGASSTKTKKHKLQHYKNKWCIIVTTGDRSDVVNFQLIRKKTKTVSLEEVSRLTVNEAREVSLFFRKPLTRENNLNRKEPTNNDFRLLTSLQISQRKTSAKFSADFFASAKLCNA